MPLEDRHQGAIRSKQQDAERPDGLTLIPWQGPQGGKSRVWNVTVASTLAPS